MLPIKNLIELVVKSLGRSIFVLKLTAIQARPQVPGSPFVAVPPAQPSHWPLWSQAIKIVTVKANGSHAMAMISSVKGHYPATLQEYRRITSHMAGASAISRFRRCHSAGGTPCAPVGHSRAGRPSSRSCTTMLYRPGRSVPSPEITGFAEPAPAASWACAPGRRRSAMEEGRSC
jgi:hypothetical protein